MPGHPACESKDCFNAKQRPRSEWGRAAVDAKLRRCLTRLAELSEEQEMERIEKEALREKHVKERLQKYSILDVTFS